MAEFWNKLKDWQKGGLIGLIIGVIYVSYAILNSKSTTFSEEFKLLSSLSLILPIAYGALNGYIFSTIKNFSQQRKWLIFVGSLIASGLIFFLVGWILLINIAKPY